MNPEQLRHCHDCDARPGQPHVVDVLSQRSGERLAQIKWYGPWRCYTLHPVSMTIWNEQCLMDVNSYINRLKAERSNRLDDARRSRSS